MKSEKRASVVTAGNNISYLFLAVFAFAMAMGLYVYFYGGALVQLVPAPGAYGHIKIVKVVEGDNPPKGSFSFSAGGQQVSLSAGESKNLDLAAVVGTKYIITEQSDTRWDQVSATCDNGENPATGVTPNTDYIPLGPTCTFVNKYNPVEVVNLDCTGGNCGYDGKTCTYPQTCNTADSSNCFCEGGTSTYCGDGTVQKPNSVGQSEECEPPNNYEPVFGNLTCASYGFQAGELGCDGNCKINTDHCYNNSPPKRGGVSSPDKCGDGKKTGDEECDGNDFGSGITAEDACNAKGKPSVGFPSVSGILIPVPVPTAGKTLVPDNPPCSADCKVMCLEKITACECKCNEDSIKNVVDYMALAMAIAKHGFNKINIIRKSCAYQTGLANSLRDCNSGAAGITSMLGSSETLLRVACSISTPASDKEFEGNLAYLEKRYKGLSDDDWKKDQLGSLLQELRQMNGEPIMTASCTKREVPYQPGVFLSPSESASKSNGPSETSCICSTKKRCVTKTTSLVPEGETTTQKIPVSNLQGLVSQTASCLEETSLTAEGTA